MNKLETWHEISVLLKRTKVREMELRKELCEELIGGEGMTNGRVTVKGHEGHLDFTAVQALSYRLDVAALDALWSSLSQHEKSVIVYKPSLALTEYKKLHETSILHEAVITTLAMPTLVVAINDGY